MSFKNVLTIFKINLKHNFLIHFIIAVIIALLVPFVFSINSLDAKYSAQPLEMLLVFIGAILLTPVFLPEQNEEILDVVRSKKTEHLFVCMIRIAYSVASIMLITAAFVLVMKYCGCDVTWQHLIGSFSSSLFLGTIGFTVAGLSKNTSAGYMAAMVYYVANIGLKDKLGVCYLFSMYSEKCFTGKYWLIGISVFCILMTLSLLHVLRIDILKRQ